MFDQISKICSENAVKSCLNNKFIKCNKFNKIDVRNIETGDGNFIYK